MKKHFRDAVVILLLTVFLFLGLDYSFTHLSYRFPKRFIAREKSVLRTPSSFYHHGFLPKSEEMDFSYKSLRYPIVTNSLGFRDASKRTVPLRSNKHRILFIGDSFVEGLGMTYEASMVGQLAAYYRKHNVEVLNAGGSSYSPIIYLRKLRHLIEAVGLKFDEVVLFLDVSDIQDELFYNFDEAGNVQGPQSPWHLSQMYGMGKFRYSLATNFALTSRAYESYLCWVNGCPPRPLGNPRATWTSDKNHFKNFGQEGLKRAIIHMDELSSLLKKHKIKLTLAVYPWPDHIWRDELDSLQVRQWEAWSRSQGVSFINFFPVFIGKVDKATFLEDYFLPNDCHWSPLGNQFMAENFIRLYKPSRVATR